MCLLLVAAAAALAGVCAGKHAFAACASGGPAPGRVCRLEAPASVLRPTQFVLGGVEVACRVHHMQRMSDKKLDAYLAGHVVPLVAADGQLMILDHHHLVGALRAAGRAQGGYAYVNVTLVLNGLAPAELWAEMLRLNYTFPVVDAHPLPPHLLPPTVAGVVNDVWRSLVYFVRHQGGYGPTSPPTFFQDFLWAAFLRTRLPPPPPVAGAQFAQLCHVDPSNAACVGNVTVQYDWIQSVLRTAVSLCRSAAASSLPGYGLGIVDLVKC